MKRMILRMNNKKNLTIEELREIVKLSKSGK